MSALSAIAVVLIGAGCVGLVGLLAYGAYLIAIGRGDEL